MRLDGEPWAQPFPAKGAAEGPLRVPSLSLPSREAAFAICLRQHLLHSHLWSHERITTAVLHACKNVFW